MNPLLIWVVLWSPPASTIPVVVRPTDLDSKGHVNHARHLEYLQWGRWRWLGDRGLDEAALKGVVLVVARVEIDYSAECHYGETLSVMTSAATGGKKTLVFSQRIDRPDGSRVADARVILVAIDPASRRSVPLPDAVRKVVEGP